MTVWLVSIDRREEHEGNETLGPFSGKAGAIQAVRDYVEDRYHPESIIRLLAAYGGDLDKGAFYSEDETIEVYERMVK